MFEKKTWISLFITCILSLLICAKGLTQHLIDLANTSADMEIVGLTFVNKTGHALAVGDVNGDSIDDLIVGAPGLDENSMRGQGRVYVFLGSPLLPTNLDLNTDTADLEITGRQAHGGLGTAVVAADINADGIEDIIMGEPGYNGISANAAGAIYVVFGRASLPKFMSVLDANVRISGEKALDNFGETMATGDLNNDDRPDVIVGVPLADPPSRSNGGKVFVIYGKTEWPVTLDLATTPADLVVFGPTSTQFLGNSVAAADLNTDGKEDLIIGSNKANATGGIDAGKTYIIFSTDTLKAQIDLAIDEPGVVISGADQRDHFGIAVNTGDFDGDSLPDLIVGARRADDGDPRNVGKVYVFINSNSWPAQIDLTEDSADVTIVGSAETRSLGFALAMGNINGDSKSDLVMGASFSSPENRSQSGESFVLMGRALSGEKINFQSNESDVIVLGAATEHALGNAVAAGDLNGDGRDELVIAAEDAGPAGRVYVFSGDAVTHVTESGNNVNIPEKYILHQNYPNPFNAGTTISIKVPVTAEAFDVSIFNMKGQKVKALYNGTAFPGTIKLHWNGNDDSGRTVGNGIYFYTLKSGEFFKTTRKLVLLK